MFLSRITMQIGFFKKICEMETIFYFYQNIASNTYKSIDSQNGKTEDYKSKGTRYNEKFTVSVIYPLKHFVENRFSILPGSDSIFRSKKD